MTLLDVGDVGEWRVETLFCVFVSCFDLLGSGKFEHLSMEDLTSPEGGRIVFFCCFPWGSPEPQSFGPNFAFFREALLPFLDFRRGMGMDLGSKLAEIIVTLKRIQIIMKRDI